MHPKTPWFDFRPNLQMVKHLSVQFRVWGEEFLNGAIFGPPRLCRIVSLLTREEAVVRQKLSAVAGRQDNLIPFAFLSTPVLQCAILGVVHQAEPDRILSFDVSVQAALVGRSLFRCDSNNPSNGRSDSICTDDQIVAYNLAVLEDDGTRLQIDIATLDPRQR